eukprot:scaffold10509_cov36-Prasinocladus_malaysianus.AAC.1
MRKIGCVLLLARDRVNLHSTYIVYADSASASFQGSASPMTSLRRREPSQRFNPVGAQRTPSNTGVPAERQASPTESEPPRVDEDPSMQAPQARRAAASDTDIDRLAEDPETVKPRSRASESAPSETEQAPDQSGRRAADSEATRPRQQSPQIQTADEPAGNSEQGSLAGRAGSSRSQQKPPRASSREQARHKREPSPMSPPALPRSRDGSQQDGGARSPAGSSEGERRDQLPRKTNSTNRLQDNSESSTSTDQKPSADTPSNQNRRKASPEPLDIPSPSGDVPGYSPASSRSSRGGPGRHSSSPHLQPQPTGETSPGPPDAQPLGRRLEHMNSLPIGGRVISPKVFGHGRRNLAEFGGREYGEPAKPQFMSQGPRQSDAGGDGQAETTQRAGDDRSLKFATTNRATGRTEFDKEKRRRQADLAKKQRSRPDLMDGIPLTPSSSGSALSPNR